LLLTVLAAGLPASQCASLCDMNDLECCCNSNAILQLSTTIVDNVYTAQGSGTRGFAGYWGYNYSSHVVTFIPPVVTTVPTMAGLNYTRTLTYNICMTGNNRECLAAHSAFNPCCVAQ
jgi:hypothetical protein